MSHKSGQIQLEPKKLKPMLGYGLGNFMIAKNIYLGNTLSLTESLFQESKNDLDIVSQNKTVNQQSMRVHAESSEQTPESHVHLNKEFLAQTNITFERLLAAFLCCMRTLLWFISALLFPIK